MRWPLLLLGVHLLSRFILDGSSAFTYLDTLPGLSFAKLYSIGTIALLLTFLLFKKERITGYLFGPVSVLVLMYFVSAGLNDYWSGIFIEAAKWLYFFALMSLTVYCVKKSGVFATALVFWASLLYVLFNQLLTGLTHGPVFLAGQYSYYGTYGHESDVSFMILLFISATLVLLVSAERNIWRAVFAVALVYGHVALVLCNYRTSLIALAFVWIFLLLGWLRRSSVLSSAIVLPVLFAGLFTFLLIGGDAIHEKMADLFRIVADPGKYFDFSGNARETGLLSGRIDLWNAYIHAYLRSDIIGILIGIGPTKGSELIGAYAHNEYVSALVETGLLGLMAFLGVIVALGRLALKTIAGRSIVGMATAPLIIGIFVMALGTMPFRNIRAMMLLAFCCALLHSVSEISKRKPSFISPRNSFSRENSSPN